MDATGFLSDRSALDHAPKCFETNLWTKESLYWTGVGNYAEVMRWSRIVIGPEHYREARDHEEEPCGTGDRNTKPPLMWFDWLTTNGKPGWFTMSGPLLPFTLSVSKGVSGASNPPSFLPPSRNPEGQGGDGCPRTRA